MSVSLHWDDGWINQGLSSVGQAAFVLREEDNLFVINRGEPASVWSSNLARKTWTELACNPSVNIGKELVCPLFVSQNRLLLFADGNRACMLDLDKFAWSEMKLASEDIFRECPVGLCNMGGKAFVHQGKDTYEIDLETLAIKQVELVRTSQVPRDDSLVCNQQWFAWNQEVALMVDVSCGQVFAYHTLQRKYLLLTADKALPQVKRRGRAHATLFAQRWLVLLRNEIDEYAPVKEALVLDLLDAASGWQQVPISGRAPVFFALARHCLGRFHVTSPSKDGLVHVLGLGTNALDNDVLVASLRIKSNANWLSSLVQRSPLRDWLKRMDGFAEGKSGEFSNEPIVVNDKLAPVSLKNHGAIAKEAVELFNGTGILLDRSDILRSSIPSDGVVIHKNLIHYLTICYDHHLGMVLTPDMIFYTILCDIAIAIKANVELYRPLLSNTQPGGKTKLTIVSTEPEEMDFGALIKELEKHSPVDVSLFTAQFSTTSVASELAMRAAFLDALSVYYEYANTCCGISRIIVRGTMQDWQALEEKVTALSAFFQRTDQRLSDYLKGAAKGVLNVYSSRDPAHWVKFFEIERCDSGHTDVVEGWVSLFYPSCSGFGMEYTTNKDYYNFDSHVSKVSWTNDDTGRKFAIIAGLFHSRVSQDNILEPEFGHVLVEIKNQVSDETFQRYVDTLSYEDRHVLEGVQKWLPPRTTLEGSTPFTEFLTKVLHLRIEQEKLNPTPRPLVFDWSNVFIQGLGYSLSKEPKYQELAKALKELVDLNVWSEIHARSALLYGEIIFANLGQLTNLQSFHVPKLGQVMGRVVELLENPESKLSKLSFEDEGDWPASLVKALSNLPRQLEELGIGAFFDAGAVVKVLKGSKNLPKVLSARSLKSDSSVAKFLAENPNAVGFDGGMEDVAPNSALFRFVESSTKIRGLSVRSFDPSLTNQYLQKLSIREPHDFSTLAKAFPNLEELSVANANLTSLTVALPELKKLRSLCLQQAKTKVPSEWLAQMLQDFFAQCGNLEILEYERRRCWGDTGRDMLAAWVASPACKLKSIVVIADYNESFARLYKAFVENNSLEQIKVVGGEKVDAETRKELEKKPLIKTLFLYFLVEYPMRK